MDVRLAAYDNHPSNSRSSACFGEIAGVSVLLLLFFALSLSASLTKSPTTDEAFHLVAGYSYLKWGDLELTQSTRPLLRSLIPGDRMSRRPRIESLDSGE